MEKLMINGLQGEGPGDIVGAFVNEAKINPQSIGDIQINNSTATVEIEAEAAEKVVKHMDGEKIGRSTVSVQVHDGELQSIHSYVQKYKRLVELERKEEMQRHEEEISRLSGPEREAKGRAILHLRGRDIGKGLAGYRVKFLRQKKGEMLPDTEIRTGDLVMISRDKPLADDNPTGTVSEVTKFSVTVSFNNRPPGFVFGKNLRMDLYVNDITYQRMKDALQALPEAEGRLTKLRNIIAGEQDPQPGEKAKIDSWHNLNLNSSQKAAVRRAVGSEDFHLIHGPPGTGKTTTVVEVIGQCVDNNETVLASAASNTAVDNILEFLLEENIDAVRVGHPARVIPTLKNQTLDARIEDYEDYRDSQKLREQAFDLMERQEELTHPSGRWRRGMSDSKIKQLAEEGRGSRGVPAEKIAEMAHWLKIQEDIDRLFEEAEKLEDEAIDQLLADVDVVCTTNSTAGSELLSSRSFDTLVIDEATQATEPSCLIPITRAKRVIMAGDHQQLPPTILSQQAARSGLRETLFERMASNHYDEIVSLLRRQYRMHEKIMNFSSGQFYNQKLEAHSSVRNHTLEDLGISSETLTPGSREALEPSAPLVFADTVQAEAPEFQRRGSSSRENPFEANYTVKLVEELLENDFPPEEIAIISPYDDQVDRIKGMIDEEEIEVDTVDGFQGREKEVVFISLVRSNDRNEIGFLNEPRRFNVAVTRARRKVVVIGDSSTIARADIFADFVDYAKNRAKTIGAW